MKYFIFAVLMISASSAFSEDWVAEQLTQIKQSITAQCPAACFIRSAFQWRSNGLGEQPPSFRLNGLIWSPGGIGNVDPGGPSFTVAIEIFDNTGSRIQFGGYVVHATELSQDKIANAFEDISCESRWKVEAAKADQDAIEWERTHSSVHVSQ